MTIESIIDTLTKRDAALRVLVLTPHIVAYLETHDPMALKQARESLGIAAVTVHDFLEWVRTKASYLEVQNILKYPGNKIAWIKLVRTFSQFSRQFRNMFPSEDLYLSDTLGLAPAKKWVEANMTTLTDWEQQQRR